LNYSAHAEFGNKIGAYGESLIFKCNMRFEKKSTKTFLN